MTYPNIPELINELEIFTYEMGLGGRIRYMAPEGEHDDCVCSLALAMYQIGERLPVHKDSKPTYGQPFTLRSGGYNKPIFHRA